MFISLITTFSMLVLNIAARIGPEAGVGETLTEEIHNASNTLEEIESEQDEAFKQITDFLNACLDKKEVNFDEEKINIETTMKDLSEKIADALKIKERRGEIEQAKHNGDITEKTYNEYSSVILGLDAKKYKNDKEWRDFSVNLEQLKKEREELVANP